MSTKEEEFLERLRATFKVEAEEHLQAITAGLLQLEKTPVPSARRKIVETVFRAAHSLKGAARAVDFGEIETLCQSLEDVFASWKRQESAPAAKALDTLHRTLDAISATMAASETSPGTPSQPGRSSLRQSSHPLATPALPSIANAPARVERTPADTVPSLAPGAADTFHEETVRIAVSKLDARLVAAEEMLQAKLTTAQRAADLYELAGRFEVWRRAWAAVEPETRALRQKLARPALARADAGSAAELAHLLEFFDWSLDYVKSVENNAVALGRTANQDRRVISKLVDDLLEDSKKLLLLPFATIAAPFAKLVRDLCREQGKEAELLIHGEEVEIDKRILEEMKDPLIHLLRNSIDHGIETSEQRIGLGKPPRGTIALTVSSVNGNKVELLVSDDGAGIDTDKIKGAAIKHGLITAEEARQLGESEARALIFQSDVTTSPIITRLSGRGLGLAIVREKAEKLGGVVAVESRPGLGTSIRVVLPTMLATFQGVLVESAGWLFVVPTIHVDRVARVQPDDIQTVEGLNTISLSGRAMPLARLADALELPPAKHKGVPSAGALVIVLGTGDQRVAFAVDAVLDEQEVLVKPLRPPLSRVRNVAGATILASGQLAPILNVADLLKSAKKTGGAIARAAVVARLDEVKAKAILVVEDSITSRMLLKSILESADYNVKTAVDGMDAFTQLRMEHFDLVVSDVEMPRLDGFDLTAKIRADKKLADLPVVLLTALETREDRERGIDVGASAYIVKSSFDQSNLLEAIRRLI